jgi:hypothetical protein
MTGSNVGSPTAKAGAAFVDRLPPEATARRLIKRLERLGYQVTHQSLPPDAMPDGYFHVSMWSRPFFRQNKVGVGATS